MKQLVTSMLLVLAFTAQAAFVKESAPPDYNIISSAPEAGLDVHHAVFAFQFSLSPEIDINGMPVAQMFELSCNGVIERFSVTGTQLKTITVSPGAYQFRIISDSKFILPIITDSIVIQPGHKTTVSLLFRSVPLLIDQPITVCKPVIYLYPEKDQPVAVTLTPKGRFTFTYPPTNGSWKGTAHPDGSISIAGKRYPYLFWEGEDKVSQLADYTTGFVVKRDEVVVFLEEKLSEMNLNDKEKTDFITFWGPRMVAAKQGFVQFVFNKAYDDIATLDIQPAPKEIFRVYMLWTPLDKDTHLHPDPQVMEKVTREGFYAIEWGGSELPQKLVTQQL